MDALYVRIIYLISCIIHLRNHVDCAVRNAERISTTICIDIDQLMKIMRITGTPDNKLLLKMQSEEVTQPLCAVAPAAKNLANTYQQAITLSGLIACCD